MTSSDSPPTTKPRKGWRLPAPLVKFMKREIRNHNNMSVGHLGRTILASFLLDGFELSAAGRERLEAERAALRMTRRDYYVHILDRRARTLRGAAGAPHRAAEPLQLDRFTSGVTVFQNWYLAPECLEALLRDAEAEWMDKATGKANATGLCVYLVNMYASYYPLSLELAERLERERLEKHQNRLEYFKTIWWAHAEGLE